MFLRLSLFTLMASLVSPSGMVVEDSTTTIEMASRTARSLAVIRRAIALLVGLRARRLLSTIRSLMLHLPAERRSGRPTPLA